MSLNKWLGVGVGAAVNLGIMGTLAVNSLAKPNDPKDKPKETAIIGGITLGIIGAGLLLGGKTPDTFGRGVMYGAAAFPALVVIDTGVSLAKGQKPALFSGEKQCPVLAAAKGL